MTWLKEIGIVLANIIGIGQMVQPFLPAKVATVEGKIVTVTNDLATLFGIVLQQEANGAAAGLTGIQKLQGAVAQAQPVFVQMLSDAGLQFDPTKMQGVGSGIVQIMNGIVAIQNNVQSKK